ncbi:MAG: AtpZ/AtpI family protein [Chitinophagales bacterium]
MAKQPQDQKDKKALLDSSYVRYSSVGFQMIGIILLGTFGGIELDKYWQSSPLFTILFVVLAVVFAMVIVIRSVTKK